jgi:hypothetical protein
MNGPSLGSSACEILRRRDQHQRYCQRPQQVLNARHERLPLCPVPLPPRSTHHHVSGPPPPSSARPSRCAVPRADAAHARRPSRRPASAARTPRYAEDQNAGLLGHREIVDAAQAQPHDRRQPSSSSAAAAMTDGPPRDPDRAAGACQPQPAARGTRAATTTPTCASSAQLHPPDSPAAQRRRQGDKLRIVRQVERDRPAQREQPALPIR